MEGFLSVKEATKSYAQGCKAKAATPIGKLFGKAMLAGMMIGMGILFHCTSPDSFLFHTYTIQSQSQFNLNKVCFFHPCKIFFVQQTVRYSKNGLSKTVNF